MRWQRKDRDHWSEKEQEIEWLRLEAGRYRGLARVVHSDIREAETKALARQQRGEDNPELLQHVRGEHYALAMMRRKMEDRAAQVGIDLELD